MTLWAVLRHFRQIGHLKVTSSSEKGEEEKEGGGSIWVGVDKMFPSNKFGELRKFNLEKG